jgi:antitoxin ParD1/3/4
MAMVKKSITVTDQQEDWIQQQMNSGHYGTDSELIREALREKQNRMAEVEAIRTLLIEGENSGVSKMTPEELIEAVIEKRRRNGRL